MHMTLHPLAPSDLGKLAVQNNGGAVTILRWQLTLTAAGRPFQVALYTEPKAPLPMSSLICRMDAAPWSVLLRSVPFISSSSLLEKSEWLTLSPLSMSSDAAFLTASSWGWPGSCTGCAHGSRAVVRASLHRCFAALVHRGMLTKMCCRW